MLVSRLPPNTVPSGLQIERVECSSGGVAITARSGATSAACPGCGVFSSSRHSRYWRKFADLPWQDHVVTWRVQISRFRCRRCVGRVFSERLPGVVGVKGRRTLRLADAQTEIGLALGGEPGARLTRRLAMPASGDTILRLIRQRPLPAHLLPRVIGVDDWAWRRGRRYGTIICDLEQRRVLDLLPDRSAEPLQAWLKDHPSVTVISRDRAGTYAEAGRKAAPLAVQVADRWHLLVNASEALRAVLDRHDAKLREAARLCAPRKGPAPASTAPAPAPASAPKKRRHERFETVRRLHQQSLPIKEIVRRTGVARNAVRRWLRAGEAVAYRRAPGPSLLDAHLAFVEARWQAGERNGARLWRDLCEQGFKGGYDIVRRWIGRRRRIEGAQLGGRPPPCRAASSRRAARLLTSDPASLSDADRHFIDKLRALTPEIRVVADLINAFGRIIRGADPGALDPWLEAAATTALCGFAQGLRADQEAVRAAIALPWSNGQPEGQINRLKLIKRQMFSRAKFDLLRQRVLCAA